MSLPTGFEQRSPEQPPTGPDLAPRASPRRRRRVQTVLCIGVMVLAAAAVISQTISVPSPHIVTADADGSVLIRLDNLNLLALQEALRKAGVNAVVLEASPPDQCHDPYPEGLPVTEQVRVLDHNDPYDILRINPKVLPRNAILLLVSERKASGKHNLTYTVTNTVPSCVTSIPGTV